MWSRTQQLLRTQLSSAGTVVDVCSNTCERMWYENTQAIVVNGLHQNTSKLDVFV